MKNQLIPIERVEKLILLLRGEKVLLGQQLAELYDVPVKVLIQAVKRNRSRFPEDFMFQLSREEFDHLKSQFVTSSGGGLRRALPYAFTEQGVAMLSSVLRSERAVQVNVAIMRAFVGLRRLLATNEALAAKLAELECHLEGHDHAIKSLFDAIRQLAAPPAAKPPREIGFHVKDANRPYRVKKK
ncbi:MAG: ORF6N domain-containing protein [Verrucomicrobia bacterium]|nr:ORF6N domain-containing protein [Verrucomicrobiota bacterium]